MVYCGPLNPEDPTVREYEFAVECARGLDAMDDPEYYWAFDQMARVGVALPYLLTRPDPRWRRPR